MGVPSDFRIGQTIQIQDGRSATVRFVGTTQFAAGDWVGVELEDASGKNDGAVQGQRYFNCQQAHGMFVRPAAAIIVKDAPSQPAKKATTHSNGAVTKSRPSSIVGAQGPLRRQSVVDPVSKRASVNTSPTPAGGRVPARTSKSPTKLATVQAASRSSSGSSSVKPNTTTLTTKNVTTTGRGRPSFGPRASMAPPAAPGTQRNSRTFTTGTNFGVSKPSMTGPQKPASRLSHLQNGKSTKSDSASISSQASAPSDLLSPIESAEVEGVATPTSDGQESPARQILSPPLSQASVPAVSSAPRAGMAPRGRATSTSQKNLASTAAANKKVEELEAKLRVMEKKRMEDRDKLKGLEKTGEERDKYKSIIQKLEGKLQPQQHELTELRKRVKEAETRADASESQALDLDTAAEMATLDREMAEEKAEAAQAELATIKAKVEELELEAEVLREENDEYSKDVGPEERAAHGWIHMEKENERLREALMRLRDMTQDQESTLKDTMQSLEHEVDELRKFREMYDDTNEKLAQSESNVETLRENLETALGAEEMIEELTEKNMSLSEKIDSMKVEIEDLESLRELTEEIETAHVETEKQLQDEIDYNEALYIDQVRQSEAKEETIKDLKYTVTRFRELVSTLQKDLQEMQASRQISETEASELTSRTRAMMDLNMRLQTSASRTQVKAIDLDLQKLQVQETAQHLAIVQSFLPEGYSVARGSINALLRSKRIGFKANLVHGFIIERLDGVAVQGREEDMFHAIEMLSKLAWINATCQRFTVFIESCPVEAFKKFEGAMYDLEPVERSLNAWIDGLKKDTLKEKQCSSELDRTIAIMTHLSEVHITEGLREFAQHNRMRAKLMQSQLESAAFAIKHLKSISQARVLLPVDADEELEQEAQDFLQKADGLVTQLRSAKLTAGKSIQQLDELADRSLSLDESALPSIEHCQNSVAELLSACLSAGMATTVIANEEGREDDLGYRDILKAIGSNETSPFHALLSQTQSCGKQVQDFHNLTATFTQTTEFPSSVPQAPWKILAQQVKDEISSLEKTVVDLRKAKAEIAEKNTALAMKDKVAEEMDVRIEVLEKRVGESGGKREKLKELEKTVDTFEANEKELTKQLAEVERRLQAAEAEKETLRNQPVTTGTKPTPGYIDEDLRQQVLTTNAVLQDNNKRLTEMVKILHDSMQSKQMQTSTASQKVATVTISVPITPRKNATKENFLGQDARKVYGDSPMPKAEWSMMLQQLSKALAWRTEKEKVRFPVQEQDVNQGAWEHLRDDVYGDYKYTLATPTKKGVGRKVIGSPISPWVL